MRVSARKSVPAGPFSEACTRVCCRGVATVDGVGHCHRNVDDAARPRAATQIGVPVQSRALSGVDSLYSIVQMPGGVPVATMAIGEAGATNAALTALRILSIEDQTIAAQLVDFAKEHEKIAEAMSDELI